MGLFFGFFENFGVGAEVDYRADVVCCCEVGYGGLGGGCWEGGAVEEGGFEGLILRWGVVYEG